MFRWAEERIIQNLLNFCFRPSINSKGVLPSLESVGVSLLIYAAWNTAGPQKKALSTHAMSIARAFVRSVPLYLSANPSNFDECAEDKVWTIPFCRWYATSAKYPFVWSEWIPSRINLNVISSQAIKYIKQPCACNPWLMDKTFAVLDLSTISKTIYYWIFQKSTAVLVYWNLRALVIFDTFDSLSAVWYFVCFAPHQELRCLLGKDICKYFPRTCFSGFLGTASEPILQKRRCQKPVALTFLDKSWAQQFDCLS